MTKKLKKVLALLLTLSMVMSMVTVGAMAADYRFDWSTGNDIRGLEVRFRKRALSALELDIPLDIIITDGNETKTFSYTVNGMPSTEVEVVCKPDETIYRVDEIKVDGIGAEHGNELRGLGKSSHIKIYVTMTCSHSSYDNWVSDGNGTHTHQCSNCIHTETENHSFSIANCTTPATCTVCGQTQGTVDMNNHIGTIEDGWLKDAEGHWQTYSDCHHATEKAAHTFTYANWSEWTDCTDSEHVGQQEQSRVGTCSTCGFEKTETQYQNKPTTPDPDPKPVAVTGVELNKTELTLEVEAAETLTATVAPEDAANKIVTWSSSDTAVATVDENGVVTAVAAGTATITVTTKDGGKTATCAVTVTEKQPEPCKHENTTAVDNGDETHKVVCDDCHAEIEGRTAEPHIWGEDHACTACGTRAVAQIGDKFFTTLQNAVNSIEAEGVITMVANSNKPAVIPAGKTITLNVNGYTLTNKENLKTVLTNSGTLTITGPGNIENYTTGQGGNCYCLMNRDGGVAFLNNGITLQNPSNGDYVIWNQGSMTINNAKITKNIHASWAAIVNGRYTSTAQLTINNGEITETAGGCCISNQGGTVVVNDGVFKAALPVESTSRLTVNGGKFIKTDVDEDGVINSTNTGTLVITNGDFYALSSDSAVIRLGSTANVTISGGTFFKEDAVVNEYATEGQHLIPKADEDGRWWLGYTVAFNCNEGSEVAAQNIVKGNKAGKPEDPTRSGYTFNGWYLGDTVYDFEAPVTSDITLVAQWTENTFIVTWMDGYNEVAVKSESYGVVTEAEKYTNEYPADLTRDGYTFTGWGDPVDDANGNLTITALWSSNYVPPVTTYYTLTINYVDGEGNAVADTYTRDLREGRSYSVTSPAVEGMTPDQATVSGVLNGNTTITVTYAEDVEEPDTPTTESPDPTESPEESEDLGENDTPLTDGPETSEPPVEPTETPEPTEPQNPDEGEDLGENDTPLADVPQTGDFLWVWLTLALLSAAGLIWVSLTEKKGKRVA